MQNHADPYIRNSRQESPLDLAAQYGRMETVSKLFYYIDTDEIPGFLLLRKNHIFTARSEDTIFSFTCEDIGVVMVTKMISQ